MSRDTITAAAIYCRISQDRAGEGLGVERQETLCRQLAESKGWPVADVYVDNDLSAYSGKPRAAYERLLADLQAGLRDAVLVVDQDRLTRQPAELEGFIDVAERHNVALANVSGDVDLSTSEGRFSARIMGVVARQESEKKSERLRRQRDQAAQKGLPSGGRRAFGYEPDGMTIRAGEAELVREAASRFLAGHSLRTIVRDWNFRGVRPVTAKQWRVNSLRTVLTNPRYAGLRVHRGEVVGDAAWSAILDRDTHERIRAALGDPRKVRSGRPPAYLLTSMLVCGHCGQRLASSKRTDGTRRYMCHPPPSPGCGRIAVQAHHVEAEVRDQALAVLAGPLLADTVTADHDSSGRADALARLEAAETRLDELARAFAEGDISRREWLAGREVAEQRVASARRSLDSDERTRVLADLPSDPDALRAAWDANDDIEWRRAILIAVIDHVVVMPAAVRGRRVFDPSRIAIMWRA